MISLFIPTLLSIIVDLQAQDSLGLRYHNYDELVQEITKLNQGQCANLSRVYSIGKSVRGRDLLVMELYSSPDVHELIVPGFVYVAGMHGNERVGPELLLLLANNLCSKSKQRDSLERFLLENVRVYLLFSANPDGLEQSKPTCHGLEGRYNANGIDLNRNFPYANFTPSDPVQPETTAIIGWINEESITMSASLHGGELVVSLPWDGDASMERKNLPSDDNAFLYHVATDYASNHESMDVQNGCWRNFSGGVTNGAEWYPMRGSLQDFGMIDTNALHFTLEISCCMYPLNLPPKIFFKANRNALLKLIRESLRGVAGVVRFAISFNQRRTNDLVPIAGAVVTITNGGKSVKTTERGEFWKNLLPNTYKISITLQNNGEDRMVSEFFVKVKDRYRPTQLNILLDI